MNNQTHDCGGTILAGPDHIYCDGCAAFTYDIEGDMPTGTDRDANTEAWDAGDDRSPNEAASGFPVGEIEWHFDDPRPMWQIVDEKVRAARG